MTDGKAMTQVEKIRKNMQTILVLARGLDGRRYAQIASAVQATGQLLDTIDTMLSLAAANKEAKALLEKQLDEAIAKQEQTIKELENLKGSKTKRGRKPKETTVEPEIETAENAVDGEEE